MRLAPTLSPAQRVFSAFFLYALALGGLFPRLGDLQRAMGASERELGLALVGTACGTMVSLTLVSRWLDRIGHRAVLMVLIPGMGACFAAATWARAVSIRARARRPAACTAEGLPLSAKALAMTS